MKAHVLASALAVLVCTGTTRAQEAGYPSKPITLLVGFSPGGGTDQIARILVPKASEILKQSIVIENRTGASGVLAASLVAKAAPDGYTLLMGHVSSNVMVPAIRSKMPYNAATDFTPLSVLASVPQVVVVPNDFPAVNIAQFIELAKNRPKHLNYASSGSGTQQHFAAEMFQIATHTEMVHVPYRGSAAALVDLISGQVDVNFDTLPSVIQQIKAKKLRALAVTTRQRVASLPDVPTLIESGLPDYEISAWYMLMAPRGLPPALAQKISAAFIQAVKDPATREKLEAVNTDAVGSTPEESRVYLASEIARWARVAKEKNIHED